jgi:hypothetical protein
MSALRRCCMFALALSISLSASSCTRSSGEPFETSKGPQIRLDSSALAQARHNEQLFLSASLDSAMKHGDKEFLSLMQTGRLIETQETLARLGYGVRLTGQFDAQTRAGVRAFERRHSLKIKPEDEGSISPELQVALSYVNQQTLNTFGLPSLEVWTSTWDAPNGAARARGTWSPADPPRQTTDIWCYRNTRACHESFAYLLNGELYVGISDYDVERWDNDELVARSVSVCVGETLTINRARKSATLLRASRNDTNEACRTLRTKTDDAVLRLVDGPSIADSLNRKAADYLNLGPAAATWLKKLRNSSAGHSATPP